MPAERGTQGSFSWTSTPMPAPGRPAVQLRAAHRHGWLTADEATVYLGLPTRKALYAAVARGQVPAHRLGRRRLRFDRSELDSLLGRAR